VTIVDSIATLLGTASVAGAVAGLYYTTQRADLRDSVAKPIPHTEDNRRPLRTELRGRRVMASLVLAVHLPLTIVFLLGAVEAVASLDPAKDLDPTRVAVVVVAGLALLHGWVIWSDLRSVHARLKFLPVS
jgi:hypothetical protein